MWERDLLAGVLAAQVQGLAVASHRSAARLYGFRTVDDDVELSIRYPRQLTLPGVEIHRSRDLVPEDTTYVEGIPCATPVRTICDLGLIFPSTEMARVLRHSIATGQVNRQECWDLRYRLSRQGRNGVGMLGDVLDELPKRAELTETGIEVLLLQICEKWNLPAPALQHPVVVGGQFYRLDFAYSVEKVFIETDGVDTHIQPSQIADDGGRQNLLVASGWHPLRFTYRQLHDQPAWCARTLRRLLDLRSRSVTPRAA